MRDDRRVDAVSDNALLSRWPVLLGRAASEVHRADAEFVPLGDGRLLAVNVDVVDEEIAAGLYDAETAGFVAVAGALSDLAAVGADPLGVLLAVSLPRHDPRSAQEAVARGARAAAERAGVAVLGGDTSQGESLTVGCTALGEVAADRVTTRLGVRVGDVLVTTGPAGAGAVHAARVLAGAGRGHFRPAPRLAEGRAFGGVTHACIDSSDGLLAAIDQLARLNRVGVALDDPEEFLRGEAVALASALAVPAWAMLAVPHGDFELVCALPEPCVDALPFPVLRVGRVIEAPSVLLDGRELPMTRLRNLSTSSPSAYFEAWRSACTASAS